MQWLGQAGPVHAYFHIAYYIYVVSGMIFLLASRWDSNLKTEFAAMCSYKNKKILGIFLFLLVLKINNNDKTVPI